MTDTSVRKRKMEANYLNIGTAETPEYALCGTGFTGLSESPSAQTSSKRYVNSSSARKSVTGYDWSASFEADQIASEEALTFIIDIARQLKTGSDVEREYIQVDLDDSSGSGNTFKARKRIVAIAVSEMPDNDGEMGINGDFLGVSDPIEGTFDTTTKTFTSANPK